MLCQAQAMPSSSSYSASPFRQSVTNTFCRFHARKYLWMALALPKWAVGRAFHWQPVRSKDDRLEDLPGRHGFAAAPGAAAIRPVLLPLPCGDEGLHPLPEYIGDRPGFDCRHVPFVSYVPADRKILITDKL